MPLTPFQSALLAALAEPPRDDRYLAGGAAMHFAPNSTRYCDDLYFFHDSEAAAADVTPHFGTPGGVLPQVREG